MWLEILSIQVSWITIFTIESVVDKNILHRRSCVKQYFPTENLGSTTFPTENIVTQNILYKSVVNNHIFYRKCCG